MDNEKWMHAAYTLGFQHCRDGREPAIPIPAAQCDECNIIDLMPYLMRLRNGRRRAEG